MIVQPKYRGFICLNAHPTGCAENVTDQVVYAKSLNLGDGPKSVLVIGSSTGYGLAARIVAAFGYGAKTLGVAFEREAAKDRTASAGWYNTAAFESQAKSANRYAKSINGDAFSTEIKQQVIDTIKADMGQVDLVIYSLASPRRKHPVSGAEYKSVIKPINTAYENKTVDMHSKTVSRVTLAPASEEEIAHTVAVMGGEDWRMWIDTLNQAGVLANNAQTVAFSYIGPELTHAIYTNGTIGSAKKDLEHTAQKMNRDFDSLGLSAYISVNKAVVTQASSAIPVVPLYMSILFKVMKEKELHEGCIEQMGRLFHDRLYAKGQVQVDAEGRIRLDDWEMRPDVQDAVSMVWEKVETDNLETFTDIDGYVAEFFKLFGFGRADVDYDADVSV